MWYPPPWLSSSSVILQSSGASVQHSGEGERGRETNTDRGREKERESMCVQEDWDRRQLTPPLLLLPAEWGVLHFLRAMQRTRKRRLACVKVTIQQTQSRAADTGSWRRAQKTERDRNTEKERDRWRETDRWTDREGDRWAAAFSVMPLLSNVLHECSAFTQSEDRSGNESFSHPENYAHIVQFHSLDCPLTVPWLDVFVCSLL